MTTSTHRLEIGNLFATHLVRNHQDQPVALLSRHQGQAQPGIPGGSFDQRRPGLQITAALCLVDHFQRNPILDRTAGIGAFQLEEEFAGTGIEVIDPDNGGIADQFENVVENRHGGGMIRE